MLLIGLESFFSPYRHKRMLLIDCKHAKALEFRANAIRFLEGHAAPPAPRTRAKVEYHMPIITHRLQAPTWERLLRFWFHFLIFRLARGLADIHVRIASGTAGQCLSSPIDLLVTRPELRSV